MFIIAGFTTPSATEVPKILYIGDDSEQAERIAEESNFPRVAKLRNPQWQPLRHWSEEAAAAFEAARNSNNIETGADSAKAVSPDGSGEAAAPEPTALPVPPTPAPVETSTGADPAGEGEEDEIPLLPEAPRKKK